MTRTGMLAIDREICIALQAVETAQTAVHRATHAFSGCQLPSGAYAHLGSTHVMLMDEHDALTEELSKEAS